MMNNIRKTDGPNAVEHGKLNRLIVLTGVGMLTLLGTSVYGMHQSNHQHQVIDELTKSLIEQRQQYNQCVDSTTP